jgi:hypothetical protein
VPTLDCEGQTIWIADAHRGEGKRFVVRADEKADCVYGIGSGDLGRAADSMKMLLAQRNRGCGYVKHFTKPASFEVVARCPRCKSEQFVPIGF